MKMKKFWKYFHATHSHLTIIKIDSNYYKLYHENKNEWEFSLIKINIKYWRVQGFKDNSITGIQLYSDSYYFYDSKVRSWFLQK